MSSRVISKSVRLIVRSSTPLALAALVLLTVSATLVACGGGANPDRMEPGDQKVGATSVKVVGGAPTFAADGSVSGTGSFRTVSPFVDNNQEALLSVATTLQPGGKVTLVGFSDISLGNGVEVEFKRATAANTLSVRMIHAGNSYDASSEFTTVDASKEIVMAVDFHNNEKPAHLIVWNDTSGPAAADDFLFNTGVVPNSSPGDGKGVYWGVRLENAQVRTVTKSGVRLDDE